MVPVPGPINRQGARSTEAKMSRMNKKKLGDGTRLERPAPAPEPSSSPLPDGERPTPKPFEPFLVHKTNYPVKCCKCRRWIAGSERRWVLSKKPWRWACFTCRPQRSRPARERKEKKERKDPTEGLTGNKLKRRQRELERLNDIARRRGAEKLERRELAERRKKER